MILGFLVGFTAGFISAMILSVSMDQMFQDSANTDNEYPPEGDEHEQKRN